MLVRVLTLLAAAGLAAVGAADDKKADKSKTDPAGVPLEITITGKTAKYPFDLGGMTVEEFKKAVAVAEKGNGRPPAAPAVDLTVEIKNTSNNTIQVWAKGDQVVLTLQLKGKGALNSAPSVAMTDEFRLPEGVGLEAGKSISFPVKALTSGFRGASVYSYWTAPGEYELVATLKTGVLPIPKGSMDNGDGYGIVTLTSAPFKLTAEAKK